MTTQRVFTNQHGSYYSQWWLIVRGVHKKYLCLGSLGGGLLNWFRLVRYRLVWNFTVLTCSQFFPPPLPVLGRQRWEREWPSEAAKLMTSWLECVIRVAVFSFHIQFQPVSADELVFEKKRLRILIPIHYPQSHVTIANGTIKTTRKKNIETTGNTPEWLQDQSLGTIAEEVGRELEMPDCSFTE